MSGTLRSAFLVILSLTAAHAQDGPPTGYERVVSDDVILDRQPRDEALGRRAIELFRGARKTAEDRLGARLGEPPPRLILTPNDSEFRLRHEELVGRGPDEYALAVAIPSRRAVIVHGGKLALGASSLEATLRHELAHLVMGNVQRQGGQVVPRWFDEGLAQLAEGAVMTRDQDLDLGSQARFGTLPPLDSLAANFPPHAQAAARSYQMGLSFTLWLDAHAPGGVRDLVRRVERGESFPDAVKAATGHTPHEEEASWALDLAERHSIAEQLARSGSFWWGVVSLLALAAIARWAIQSRRLRRKMTTEETEAPP